MKRQTVRSLQRQKSYCLKYRTPEGKQKWESFKTEWEAQERRLEILDQFKDEAYVEPKTVTFKDFAEKWIERTEHTRSRIGLRFCDQTTFDSIFWKNQADPDPFSYCSEIRVQFLEKGVVSKDGSQRNDSSKNHAGKPQRLQRHSAGSDPL